MLDLKEIFRNIGKSLNPFSYNDFHERSMRRSLTHFFVIILFGTLISGLFYLPDLFEISSMVKKSLDSADEIKFNPVISFNTAVKIDDLKEFESKTKFIIDTKNEYSPNQSMYYLDDEYVYFNYGKNKKPYSEVLDVMAYKDKINNGLFWLIILLIPSLFVAYYLLTFTVLMSIVFLSSLVFSLIFIKRKVSIRKYMTIGLYASIVLVIASIFKSVEGSGKYSLFLIGIGLFWIYYLIAILFSKNKHRDKNNGPEDIDLKDLKI